MENKFRVWDKEHHIMNNNYFEDNHYLSNGGICLNDIFKQKEKYIFMQYIGRRDMDFVEIYVSDIIKVKLTAGYRECYVFRYYEVKYNQVTCSYYLEGYKQEDPLEFNRYQEYEVVGNKYENQGLLEEMSK